MKNADMPAMPMPLRTVTDSGDTFDVDDAYEGLTKREMFAMHAMQGILSGNTLSQLADFTNENGLNEVNGLLKTMSYAAADLMLNDEEKNDPT